MSGEGSYNSEMNREGSLEQIQRQKEAKKRRRELFVIFFVTFLFLLLGWTEMQLFSLAQQLPFVYSIFFFGLVNFNIVLLLLLLFLIFRNVVKVFVERKGKVFGSSLKSKLVAAFVSFSSVPTLILLFISVFYINSSFDKWFSTKMAGILKSSLEVTNAYYFNAKKKNYYFANKIASEVAQIASEKEIRTKLSSLRQEYALDVLEYYPNLFGPREVFFSNDNTLSSLPLVTLEFLQKGIRNQAEASTIQPFGEGNLVRVIVPAKRLRGKGFGAIVVSSFVPLSLISKINDISSAYEEFKYVNPIEYPLKSIYLVILILITLVILFAATWFGFHLAKQLSIPLVQLGKATRRITTGDYAPVLIESGSEEITSLVESFNQMTLNLAISEREVKEANQNLKTTLTDLDKHSRYIEVVLGSVSAGVISVDQMGKVTTINNRAGQLLKIKPESFIGKSARELLTLEYFRTFSDLLKTMQKLNAESIKKEVKINIQGEVIPLQMTLSILKDEKNQELGKILVFDDMSPIVDAQRAQAWTDVAQRIAHEIKNPLTPIKLSAERLLRKFSKSIQDPVFNECTTMIIKQTEDLKNLVNEFNQFARLPQARLTQGNIHSIIEEALCLYKSSHSSVKYSFHQDSSLPQFKFDPDQMKRVFVNLLDNSIAAMEQESNKEISIKTQYDSQLKFLRIIFSDNGIGISRGDRFNIFEPYYTTKENGTGLGLAIVKRILEDHGGFIRALANHPRGTRMVVELPVNDLGVWKPLDKKE